MEACNKHASTDKTRDDEEDKGKGPMNNPGKSNTNGGQQSNNNNNNSNQHKRPYESNPNFVGNTSTGFQKPRRDRNFQRNNGNHSNNVGGIITPYAHEEET